VNTLLLQSNWVLHVYLRVRKLFSYGARFSFQELLEGIKMSEKFKQKWEEQPTGLKKVLGQKEPLKPKINRVLSRVEAQNERINAYVTKYDSRDKEIFEKIVKAQQRHDNAHAKMLADELSEVRRQKNVLMHSKLALDNVCLRLRTVYEFGNTASSIAGVVRTLGSIRSGISGMLPDISKEIFQMERTLGDMVMDIGGTVDATFDFTPASEDVNRILKEAAVVVESRTKERLPGLRIPQEGSYTAGGSIEDNST
jgi:division protein CdvB (Snf7/Vps24/ESCRT-III family)